MTCCSKLVLAAVLTIGLNGLVAADPMPTVPSKQAPEPAKVTLSAITDEHLGQMLEGMGYEVKPGTYQGGGRYFDIQLSSKFEYYVRFSLSPNKRVVWLAVTLGDMPADVTAAQLQGLLQVVNTKTGKMQLHLAGKTVKAEQPLDNIGVTPVRLRREIEDLVASLDGTADVWSFKKPTEKTASAEKAAAK
jgi:hypothetical protein